ncbi:MAG: lysylphosphatidylglycerol synthase domain-containing protein [Candidatus Omnitrophota bacterium]
MRRNNKAYLVSYLVLFAILAAFVSFIMARKEQLYKLSHISLSYIITITFLTFLYLIINAFSAKKLTDAFGVRLTFKEWFGLSCLTSIGNYILPAKAGVTARAFYMKNKYDFPYLSFLSAYMGFYFFSFLVNAVFGIALICLRYFLAGIFNFKILLFFISVGIFIGGFMISWKWFAGKSFKVAAVNKIFSGLNYFRKQKSLLLILSGLNLLSMLVLSGRLFFAYQAIGIRPDFIAILIMANIVSLFVFVSITPANLGFKEAAITITSAVMGFTAINGALASIVDRAISILVVLFLGIIFTFVFFNEFKAQAGSKIRDENA